MTSRRQFLRMAVSAGALAVAQAPIAALAASRPSINLFFPQDPFVTWFQQTYGLTKADGRVHLGIDLMAPKMSPVFAIADGTVTRISKSPRAGRHLIIDHAKGWQSWYLHLNNDDPGRDNGKAQWDDTVVPGLEEGSDVTSGMQIAYVGDSGNAEGSGSHTHFELHLGERTVNPFPYLIDGRDRELAGLKLAAVEPDLLRNCQIIASRPCLTPESLRRHLRPTTVFS